MPVLRKTDLPVNVLSRSTRYRRLSEIITKQNQDQLVKRICENQTKQITSF